MSSNKSGKLKIEPQIIKEGRISSLHKAELQNKSYYAKVFSEQVVAQYGLEQTLDWNTQTLSTDNNFVYPDNFLFIQATIKQGSAIGFLTNKYQIKLDQFINKYGPQKQKQALIIFQDILKAVYSLEMAGYFTRNLRPEHFVKSGKTWKLQSVIDSDQANKYGLDCEYTYNSQYKPPQGYLEMEFTDEQIEQRIVWDLGCMLIYLLTKGHKLRNREALEKFKGSSFSFKKIGLGIQDYLSSQLKQILGKMCHYNAKDRLKLNEVISKQFFSKQVSQHYAKYKQLKNKKINPVESSIRSSNRSNRSVENNLKVIGAAVIADLLKQSHRKQDLKLSNRINGKIQTNQKFKENIQSIIQDDEISLDSKLQTKVLSKKNTLDSQKKVQRIPSLQQIQSKQKQNNQIIDIYKNYLDKGQILGIGAEKFHKMLQLFDNKEKGMQLIQITAFAVNFVKCIDLCKLANAMNENKSYFKIQQRKWQKFHGSSQYYGLKKLVNYRRKQTSQNVQFLRKKIITQKNSYINMHDSVNKFVKQANPQQTVFQNIKQPYRRILKLSYDMISNYYTNHKTQEWARLGMYLIFCLAIDKLYIPQKFQNNFKHFFKWSGKQPSNYISLFEFQQYIDTAPKLNLIENARFIIQEFYEIKKK